MRASTGTMHTPRPPGRDRVHDLDIRLFPGTPARRASATRPPAEVTDGTMMGAPCRATWSVGARDRRGGVEYGVSRPAAKARPGGDTPRPCPSSHEEPAAADAPSSDDPVANGPCGRARCVPRPPRPARARRRGRARQPARRVGVELAVQEGRPSAPTSADDEQLNSSGGSRRQLDTTLLEVTCSRATSTLTPQSRRDRRLHGRRPRRPRAGGDEHRPRRLREGQQPAGTPCVRPPRAAPPPRRQGCGGVGPRGVGPNRQSLRQAPCGRELGRAPRPRSARAGEGLARSSASAASRRVAAKRARPAG